MEHGGCYPDNTCNRGLYCNAGSCERIVDAGSDARDVTTADANDIADVANDGIDAAGDIADVGVPDAGPPNYAAPAMGPASCDDLTGATAVPGVLADNATSPLRPLPFVFRFFGPVVDHVSVASNGYVQLWVGTAGPPDSSPNNVAIPNAMLPNGFAAALWTHLLPGASSTARSAVIGSAPARHVTFEWAHWNVTAVAGSDVTFQIKLFEADSSIEFDYCTLSGGDVSAHSTIGLENAAGDRGVAFAFDMAAAVSAGTSLRFTPAP